MLAATNDPVMFVGHGLLAFALAASVAHAAGWSRDRVLTVGVAAFAFATVPDVDMLYAPIGLADASGLTDAARSFWSASAVTHRTITHSLVVGAAAAVAAAAWTRRDVPGSVVAAAIGGGLVVAAAAVSGGLDPVVMAAFVAATFLVAALARRHGLSPRTVLVVALLGLLTHPFGDLLTGTPPAFFYPFDGQFAVTRVALHPDPTLHLLGAMALELATVWLAAHTYARIDGRPLRATVRPTASLGLGYAASVLVVPAPTLDLAYPFVVSILGVGVVSAAPRWTRDRDWFAAAVTGLGAVTLAAVAYTASYLVL